MEKNLYKKYKVGIKVKDRLLGGKPKTEELIKGWLESRGRQDTVEEEMEEIDMAKEEEKAWTGFKRDEKGLYLDSYQIKGMIKEVVKVLRLARKKRGLRTLIQSGLFIYPARIHLGKSEPDGYIEETSQVMSARGPRSIIKRHDYVKEPEFSFQVWFFDTRIMTEDMFNTIFEAAQRVGLGTNRHEGYGQFEVTELERID